MSPDSWATPSRSFDVKTYQEGGTIVKDTYSINMFERNIQIHSIRSIDLPMLIYFLRYIGIQGDPTHWLKPPVDIKRKVPFWPG